MTLLVLALIGQLRVAELWFGTPTAQVAIGIEIVPASELTMNLAPTPDGGLWLVAEYREGGAVQKLSSWIPAGATLVTYENSLSVVWEHESQLVVAAKEINYGRTDRARP